MSPILGIWASAQQGALAVGDYESIATVTVGAGGAASVTFSSIPSTYQHLQIRGIAKGVSNAFSDMTFNGDTGNNYSFHDIYGDGTGTGAEVTTTRANIPFCALPDTANVFNAIVGDILDYTSTNKNKTVRALSGQDRNGTGVIYSISGLWYATPAAITSITITGRGSNIAQYSQFALYGIKG